MPDLEFRGVIIDGYLELASAGDLSDWLRDISCDPKGTPEEKKHRIRERYLAMKPDEFRKSTLEELAIYSADELAEVCERLKLDVDGGKSSLQRRLYREVGYREGWLRRVEKNSSSITKNMALPFLKWYPLFKSYSYEKDTYGEFVDEMSEIFGSANVHEQFAVAHGTSLKIDFHLGTSTASGLGIEFKLPASNSELQRGLGQMDQYITKYGTELVVVLFPELIKQAEEQLFVSQLERKGVTVVVKKAREE